MLHLNERQRAVLIEALPDTANVTAGGLLFGQFVSDRPFSVLLALVGLASWAALLVLSLFLSRRHI